jgi:hypothetical protein
MSATGIVAQRRLSPAAGAARTMEVNVFSGLKAGDFLCRSLTFQASI